MKKNFVKRILLITSAVLLVLTFSIGVTVADSDPLVTLGYLNKTVIPKITEDVKKAVLEALTGTTVPDTTPGTTTPGTTTPDTTTPGATTPGTTTPDTTTPGTTAPEAVTQEDISQLKYSVVYLLKGQKLMAAGDITESTEVVLRSGSVVCISPFEDQGIADLTACKELYNNDPLVKNDYCLIPRGSDGRGIYAVDGDAYILVRGEYEIVQQ